MSQNLQDLNQPAESTFQKTKTRVGRGVGRFFGRPYMRGTSTLLAKIGLRGLGINADYHLEYSGEEWFIKKLFAVLENPVCADIGANIGDYSSLCQKLGAAKIFAFEPNPHVFRHLLENTIGNVNIHCLQTAVGEHNGTTSFFIPEQVDHSTLASRDINITIVSQNPSKETCVSLVKLDDFARDEGIVFHFLKIDVEGYELEVLQGAKEICEVMKPVIQFEFNTNHLHRRQNMLDFAENLPGYALHRLSPFSLHPLDPAHYLSHIFAYQNIIAIHRDKLSIIRQFS